MDLDTSTYETIEKSLCLFFEINKPELNQFLKKISILTLEIGMRILLEI